jgi:hypothetical protein
MDLAQQARLPELPGQDGRTILDDHNALEVRKSFGLFVVALSEQGGERSKLTWNT